MSGIDAGEAAALRSVDERHRDLTREQMLRTVGAGFGRDLERLLRKGLVLHDRESDRLSVSAAGQTALQEAEREFARKWL